MSNERTDPRNIWQHRIKHKPERELERKIGHELLMEHDFLSIGFFDFTICPADKTKLINLAEKAKKSGNAKKAFTKLCQKLAVKFGWGKEGSDFIKNMDDGRNGHHSLRRFIQMEKGDWVVVPMNDKRWFSVYKILDDKRLIQPELEKELKYRVPKIYIEFPRKIDLGFFRKVTCILKNGEDMEKEGNTIKMERNRADKALRSHMYGTHPTTLDIGKLRDSVKRTVAIADKPA